MNTISTDLLDKTSEARRQVETYCQSLVDADAAHWRVNESGETELHLESGETFLFGDLGVTRLK
ncbi:hypothetical protein ACQKPT_00795 [Pseudomonas monteilii]|uniref:hypothetical protein n=1 Tax=Pseudomonas monteilii TaxID=76759 RepID=UPI003CFCD880